MARRRAPRAAWKTLNPRGRCGQGLHPCPAPTTHVVKWNRPGHVPRVRVYVCALHAAGLVESSDGGGRAYRYRHLPTWPTPLGSMASVTVVLAAANAWLDRLAAAVQRSAGVVCGMFEAGWVAPRRAVCGMCGQPVDELDGDAPYGSKTHRCPAPPPSRLVDLPTMQVTRGLPPAPGWEGR